MNLDSKIPSGPIEKKWSKHKFDMKLVNPANRRHYRVIVVGSGLAGASAAATLGEQREDTIVRATRDPSRASRRSFRRDGKRMRRPMSSCKLEIGASAARSAARWPSAPDRHQALRLAMSITKR